MEFSERDREIAKLRQAISRSREAITALQNFVQQTESKLRKVEGETQFYTATINRRMDDVQIPRLRMFQ